ncbi:hypothetical protein NYE25_06535 [Paenibacillus sp. FSL E2-8871]|jgi:hypothetical protein|uniref:hypothetical protein n=1 Tax=Paenibacillus sp. FSL E2-8871 TaxID=2975326 RepID=UPI0030FA6538
MKFEIFTTDSYLGKLDSESIFDEKTNIVAVGSLIVVDGKKCVVKDVVVRQDGDIKLIV